MLIVPGYDGDAFQVYNYEWHRVKLFAAQTHVKKYNILMYTLHSAFALEFAWTCSLPLIQAKLVAYALHQWFQGGRFVLSWLRPFNAAT